MDRAKAIRSPHLIRDRKTVRPDVAEEVLKVPEVFRTPLLLGKLHAELHEVALEPTDVEEYGDVLDVLGALAGRYGHSMQAVMEAARTRVGSEIDHVEFKHADLASFEQAEVLRNDVHYHVEAAARDLGNEEHFVAVVAALLASAELLNLSLDDDAEAVWAKKREWLGDFEGAHFWRRLDQ